MPILPLIRESMVRAHARGIENAILAGNHDDGHGYMVEHSKVY